MVLQALALLAASACDGERSAAQADDQTSTIAVTAADVDERLAAGRGDAQPTRTPVPTPLPTPTAVVPTPIPGDWFIAVSSGEYHTCALPADGEPVCWGADPVDPEAGLSPVDFGQASAPQGEQSRRSAAVAFTSAACAKTAPPCAGGAMGRAKPRRPTEMDSPPSAAVGATPARCARTARPSVGASTTTTKPRCRRASASAPSAAVARTPAAFGWMAQPFAGAFTTTAKHRRPVEVFRQSLEAPQPIAHPADCCAPQVLGA